GRAQYRARESRLDPLPDPRTPSFIFFSTATQGTMLKTICPAQAEIGAGAASLELASEAGFDGKWRDYGFFKRDEGGLDRMNRMGEGMGHESRPGCGSWVRETLLESLRPKRYLAGNRGITGAFGAMTNERSTNA